MFGRGKLVPITDKVGPLQPVKSLKPQKSVHFNANDADYEEDVEMNTKGQTTGLQPAPSLQPTASLKASRVSGEGRIQGGMSPGKGKGPKVTSMFMKNKPSSPKVTASLLLTLRTPWRDMKRSQKATVICLAVIAVSVIVGIAAGIGIIAARSKTSSTGAVTVESPPTFSNSWTADDAMAKALADNAALLAMYNNWRLYYGYDYSDVGLQNFRDNLDKVVTWNKGNFSSRLLVNKYSGLSTSDFSLILTPGFANFSSANVSVGKTLGEPPRLNWILGQPTDYKRRLLQFTAWVNPVYNNLPGAIDWRTLNRTTPVQDQELCGSNWALTAASAIESATLIKFRNLTTVEVSREAILQCTQSSISPRFSSKKCGKGSVLEAFEFASTFHLPLEDTYGQVYSATNGTCDVSKINLTYSSNVIQFVPNSYAVNTPGSAWNMMLLLYRHPVVAYIRATHAFQLYKEGVFDDDECAAGDVANYAVLVIGYNRMATPPFWIVQGSFGASWGIDGYAYIKMADSGTRGACGMYEYVHGPPTQFAIWPKQAGAAPVVAGPTVTVDPVAQPLVPDSPIPGSDPNCMISGDDNSWGGYIAQNANRTWTCATYWKLKPHELASAAVNFQLCRFPAPMPPAATPDSTCKLDPFATDLSATTLAGTSYYMFSRCENITFAYDVCNTTIPDGVFTGPVRTIALPTAPDLPLFLEANETKSGTCPTQVPADAPSAPELKCAYAKISLLRSRYDAPALAWDATLAKQVADWLAATPACPGNVNASTVNGSLVNALGYANSAGAVDGWFSQGTYYDYTRRLYDWRTYGFTAIVYKSVSKVGCAIRTDCSLYGGIVSRQLSCAFGPRFTFGTPDMVTNVVPLNRR